MNNNVSQESDEMYLRMIVACPRDGRGDVCVCSVKNPLFSYKGSTIKKYFPYLILGNSGGHILVVMYKINRLICCSIFYLNIPCFDAPIYPYPFEPILDIKKH